MNTKSNISEELSKTEARAKRKEAKKQNKTMKKNNETKPEIKADMQSISNCNLIHENQIKKSVNTEVSKAELKAQRRAIQEAQRQAKLASKGIDIPSVLSDNNAGISVKNCSDNNVLIIGITDSKAELRAKRRAIQEAQRQVKSQIQETQKAKSAAGKLKDAFKFNQYVVRKESISVVTGGNFQKQVQLFNHLYFQHSTSLTKNSSVINGLHSSIIRLGVRYVTHEILGSNARCLALLSAIKRVVNDYRTPFDEDFARSLELNLQISFNYLQTCRPFAVSMTNAIRYIKAKLNQFPANLPEYKKREFLLESIDTYITDEIGVADDAISISVQAKINTGDVLLTYGCSSIVLKILLEAHAKNKQFSVVVVDSRPLLEGRQLLRKLMNAHIRCSYAMINSVTSIMGRVTKVLLGAHSLLANGFVMSRCGTAQIALIAQTFNTPVLVCCETYKFCERVQTDSIVHNEIGDPDKLIAHHSNSGEEIVLWKNWKDCKYVTPLNLMYDVTPPDLVTAVVTELAILPCTSVPVILRIKPSELVA